MPIDMDLTINVDLNACAADGTVIHTIEAKTATDTSLVLDAIDMLILSVSSGNDEPLTWDYDGERISIHWDKPFSKHERRSVAVQFQVVHPIAGMMFSGPLEVGQWMATDHETQRARYWLPCIDHSNVRTPVRTAVTHKSELTCLGPGQKIETIAHDKGFTTTVWKLEQACPSYLLCLVVGDLPNGMEII